MNQARAALTRSKDTSIELFFGRPSADGVVRLFVSSPEVDSLAPLFIYVDETGDRGAPGGKASPVFGMAAVIADEAGERQARGVLQRLRQDLSAAPGTPLSWKNNLKTHSRRKYAASLLKEVDGLRIVYVICKKDEFRSDSMVSDVTTFYNWVAYKTLERILWACAYWGGGRRRAVIRYGHVRNHDWQDTHRYFQIKASKPSNVPFELISSLSWVSANQWEMSQVADLYAGFLKAGFWPDEFGATEGVFIRTIWPQIVRSERCVLNLGLMICPRDSLAGEIPWWPCVQCRRANPQDR